MEKYDCGIRIGVNVDTSELDKMEAQLKRIVDLLERINKPRRITITDGDGNLRCVLGPLDVEQGEVFIKNATIQKVIFSANYFHVGGGDESNSLDKSVATKENVESILQNAHANNNAAGSNSENSVTGSYYEELNKKLDYIISLMPSPAI